MQERMRERERGAESEALQSSQAKRPRNTHATATTTTTRARSLHQPRSGGRRRRLCRGQGALARRRAALRDALDARLRLDGRCARRSCDAALRSRGEQTASRPPSTPDKTTLITHHTSHTYHCTHLHTHTHIYTHIHTHTTGVPKTLLDAYPAVKAYRSRVAAHPKVKAFYERPDNQDEIRLAFKP